MARIIDAVRAFFGFTTVSVEHSPDAILGLLPSGVLGETQSVSPRSFSGPITLGKDCSEGLLSLFPSEVLGEIFSYSDIQTIESLRSINVKCDYLVKRAVTAFCGRSNVPRLRKYSAIFPHLRAVFGPIRVINGEEFKEVLKLDLTHFTIQFASHPENWYSMGLSIYHEIACSMIAELKNTKSITLCVTEQFSTFRPHDYERFTPLFSLDGGILDSQDIKWTTILAQMVPFTGLTVYKKDLDALEYVELPPLDTLILKDGLGYSVLPYLLQKNPLLESVKYILTSNENPKRERSEGWVEKSVGETPQTGGDSKEMIGRFSPELFDHSYPQVEKIDIPVLQDQVPDLLRVFPGLKTMPPIRT